jgi:hypothetical protein
MLFLSLYSFSSKKKFVFIFLFILQIARPITMNFDVGTEPSLISTTTDLSNPSANEQANGDQQHELQGSPKVMELVEANESNRMRVSEEKLEASHYSSSQTMKTIEEDDLITNTWNRNNNLKKDEIILERNLKKRIYDSGSSSSSSSEDSSESESDDEEHKFAEDGDSSLTVEQYAAYSCGLRYAELNEVEREYLKEFDHLKFSDNDLEYNTESKSDKPAVSIASWQDLDDYIAIRNVIVREWQQNVHSYLTLKHCTKKFRPLAQRKAARVYAFLNQFGFINSGLLPVHERPKDDVPICTKPKKIIVIGAGASGKCSSFYFNASHIC